MSNEVERHGQIMRALGEIQGKVEGLYPTVARQRFDHEALEERTRTLEAWKWYLAGLFSLSLIGSIVGFVLR